MGGTNDVNITDLIIRRRYRIWMYAKYEHQFNDWNEVYHEGKSHEEIIEKIKEYVYS